MNAFKHSIATALTLMLAAGFVAVPVSAQVATTSLSGVVSDPSGAVIPGVNVTLTHLTTNRLFRAETDAEGRYVFLNLPIGPYRLSSSSEGFRTAEREFELTVGQSANLNLAMEVGAVSEVVDVTATAPLVNATNATVTTYIENRAIQDLPLNGRNFTQLISLTPGSLPVDVAQGGDSGPSVQGQRNRDNFYMTDGVMNVQFPRTGVGMRPPSIRSRSFKSRPSKMTRNSDLPRAPMSTSPQNPAPISSTEARMTTCGTMHLMRATPSSRGFRRFVKTSSAPAPGDP